MSYSLLVTPLDVPGVEPSCLDNLLACDCMYRLVHTGQRQLVMLQLQESRRAVHQTQHHKQYQQ